MIKLATMPIGIAVAILTLLAPPTSAGESSGHASHAAFWSDGNARGTEQFASGIELRSAKWDVQGAAFAVLYLHRLGKRRPQPDGVAIWMRSQGQSFRATLGAPKGVLPAGRYRVSLFSTGRARVDVPTDEGGSDISKHLTNQASGKVRVRTVTGNREVPPPFADSVAAFAVPTLESPLVVAGAVTKWDGVTALSYDFDVCLVKHENSCSDGDPSFGTGQSATSSSGTADAELYATRQIDVDNRDVVAEWKGTTEEPVTLFALFASRTK